MNIDWVQVFTSAFLGTLIYTVGFLRGIRLGRGLGPVPVAEPVAAAVAPASPLATSEHQFSSWDRAGIYTCRHCGRPRLDLAAHPLERP